MIPWRYLFIFFVVAFLALKIIIPLLEASSQVLTLPTIRIHGQRYHTTQQIHTNMALGPTSNPFYQIRPFPNTPMLAFEPIAAPSTKRLRVLVVCGQHGRELVSSEVCHTLIKLLQGQLKDLFMVGRLMTLIKKEVGFYVVPVNNPFSREQMERNRSSCSRVNENGVDLNRNYASNFPRPANLPVKGAEDYGGQFAVSEPETQALDEYLDYIQPHILLNVHSGGNAVLIPYDAEPTVGPPNYALLVKVLNKIRESKEYTFRYQMGPSSLLYYPSYGTLMDYALDNKGVDLALTLEIFENKTSTDCFHFFNPNEGIELADLIEKWTYFILRFVEKIERLIKNVNS